MIKGASANLMCHQLRVAAHQLEHLADAADGYKSNAELTAVAMVNIREKYLALKKACANFDAYLQSIGE